MCTGPIQQLLLPSALLVELRVFLLLVEMLDGSRIFSDVFLWFKKAEYVVLCALMFKSDLVIKEGGTVITVY